MQETVVKKAKAFSLALLNCPARQAWFSPLRPPPVKKTDNCTKMFPNRINLLINVVFILSLSGISSKPIKSCPSLRNTVEKHLAEAKKCCKRRLKLYILVVYFSRDGMYEFTADIEIIVSAVNINSLPFLL